MDDVGPNTLLGSSWRPCVLQKGDSATACQPRVLGMVSKLRGAFELAFDCMSKIILHGTRSSGYGPMLVRAVDAVSIM